MTIQVIGLDGLGRKFKSMADAVTSRSNMEKIGNYFVVKIKQRTSEGVDVDGRAFKPYSQKYSFFRQQRGLPTAKVDLFFTGSMLNSLTYNANISGQEVRIFFAPGTDRRGQSNPAKAFYLQQKRKFFGISAEDEKAAVEIYKKGITEAIRGR